MYEEEKEMEGKEYVVTTEWKISNCKMWIGDTLKVTDYGSGMVSHYVVFTNERLPPHAFRTGTSLFKRNTREIARQ